MIVTLCLVFCLCLFMTACVGQTGEKGVQGECGEQGVQGEQGIQGELGQDGQNGQDGQDGLTPYIGTNGNWWIGETDTGVVAKDETVCRVTFDTYYNILNEVVEVIKGQCLKLPIPIKEGFVFSGWYTGMGASDKKFSDCDPIYTDIKLYAKWDKVTEDYYTNGLRFVYNNDDGYSVLFDSDDYIHSSIRETITELYLPAYYNDGVHGRLPVKYIMMNAFDRFENLKKVEIPSTIKMIGQWAFQRCYSLESVNIPDSTSFSNDAFLECNSLKSINISENHPLYKSIGGIIFNKDGTRLLTAPAGLNIVSYIVPSNVIDIRSYAFAYNKSLKTIDINDNINTLRRGVFSSCTNLEEINIPATVTSIEDNVFSDCTSLKNIELSINLETLGSSVFSKCINLITITLPTRITKLERNIFSLCKNLTSVIGLNNVTQVGEGAFMRCTRLESVNLPNQIKTIEKLTFAGCLALTEITFSEGSLLTCIGDYAFSNCQNLKSLVIPFSVTSIGNNAFSFCNNLTIYAESASKPAGWVEGWNAYNSDEDPSIKIPVIWEYNKEI